MNKKHIPALTGIRAIAAFVVVIHHLFLGYFKSDYINSVLRELNVGVNIFFVLSGFLIWHRYAYNVEFNRKWFKKYIINRIARIYPMYFLWTTFVMILGFIATNSSGKDFIISYFLNISFLKGFSSDFVYSGISQGWTLSVEELFYLSAPILFILNIRKKWPLASIGLIILSIGFLLNTIFRNFSFFGFFNNLDFIRITTYFGRFPEFFAGILLAKLINHNRNSSKVNSKPIFTSIGIICLVFSILIVLPAFQTENQHYSIQTLSGYIYNVIVFPIFVAMMFYGLIYEKSLVKRILSSKTFILLGKSSYALYLVHWGMTSYLLHRFISNNIFITLISTYLLSIIMWKFYEEPANKLVRKLSNSWK